MTTYDGALRGHRSRAALSEHLGVSPRLVQPTSLSRYLATKELIDIVGAVCGILLCLPLWVVIALLIKLDSRGPVIFRQKRAGQYGIPFEILKFRTMQADAEQHVDQLLAAHGQEGASLVRLRHDPRVTRVGRILRKLSLDETPQFINVLRGEMSLVGPRPISRRIADSRGLERLRARPGMTGLWQVNGRKDTDCEYMLGKDMEYLETRSLPTDLAILGKTFGAMVRGAR
jgi:lipopolysaccharide/colanic/teichoic acid biosynthesis glycosyltransferase